MTDHEIGERLLEMLVQMWNGDDQRARKLATIASFERQFETWWKYEIGVAWEQHRAAAASEWDDVWLWLEVHDRADVVVARPQKGSATLDTERVLIPLELKTTGTWWRQIDKALAPLLSDMTECAAVSRDVALVGGRKANPFGAVAILITHVEWDDPGVLGKRPSLESMVKRAIEHGESTDLELVVNAPLHLGRVGTEHGLEHSGGGDASAHQLVWVKRTTPRARGQRTG